MAAYCGVRARDRRRVRAPTRWRSRWRALGVGPGAVVLTTPFSFFATASTIVRLGARPRLRRHRPADAEPRSRRGGPRRWHGAAARSPGILPVHLFGRLAPMDALGALADRHGLWIARGCRAGDRRARSAGRRAGTFGRAGVPLVLPDEEPRRHRGRRHGAHGRRRRSRRASGATATRVRSRRTCTSRSGSARGSTPCRRRRWAPSCPTSTAGTRGGARRRTGTTPRFARRAGSRGGAGGPIVAAGARRARRTSSTQYVVRARASATRSRAHLARARHRHAGLLPHPAPPAGRRSPPARDGPAARCRRPSAPPREVLALPIYPAARRAPGRARRGRDRRVLRRPAGARSRHCEPRRARAKIARAA